MAFIIVEYLPDEKRWIVRHWSHNLGDANRQLAHWPKGEIFVGLKGIDQVKVLLELKERLNARSAK